MPEGPVIRTWDLTKRFGRTTAVESLTMEIPRGEVFGFLGPNGAGKTTTIAMLLGLVHPTAGGCMACWPGSATLACRCCPCSGWETAILPLEGFPDGFLGLPGDRGPQHSSSENKAKGKRIQPWVSLGCRGFPLPAMSSREIARLTFPIG